MCLRLIHLPHGRGLQGISQEDVGRLYFPKWSANIQDDGDEHGAEAQNGYGRPRRIDGARHQIWRPLLFTENVYISTEESRDPHPE